MTMTNITTHTGTLTILERLPSSANGGPRFSAKVGEAFFWTAPDSSHGYTILNLENKDVTVTIGNYYGKRTLDSLATHCGPRVTPADEKLAIEAKHYLDTGKGGESLQNAIDNYYLES